MWRTSLHLFWAEPTRRAFHLHGTAVVFYIKMCPIWENLKFKIPFQDSETAQARASPTLKYLAGSFLFQPSLDSGACLVSGLSSASSTPAPTACWGRGLFSPADSLSLLPTVIQSSLASICPNIPGLCLCLLLSCLLFPLIIALPSFNNKNKKRG